MSYEKKKLKDCCISISDGDHQPPPKAEKGVPFVTISNIDSNNQLDFSDVMYVPEEYYDGLPANKKASVGDILYSVVGSFGKPVYISNNDKFVFQRHIAILKPTDEMDGKYLYYAMLNPMFYRMADKLAIGCAQRTITLDALRNIIVDIPPIEKQKSITDILNAIDGKIAVNNRINDNLEQQAQSIFDYMFKDISGSKRLGEVIIPKRGTPLLTKDAIWGNVPVVAGGLEPSTYHNKANTVAPVITISSSGANAGFVNLWGIPVWSSDSSYIDSTMTPYVYFWYAFLKSYQNNI